MVYIHKKSCSENGCYCNSNLYVLGYWDNLYPSRDVCQEIAAGASRARAAAFARREVQHRLQLRTPRHPALLQHGKGVQACREGQRALRGGRAGAPRHLTRGDI